MGAGSVKPCTKCSILRPLSDFHRDRRSSDGHKTQCKRCAIAAAADYVKRHPEETAAYLKEYTEKNRDRLKAKRKSQYWANRDKAIRAAAIWARANPERRSEIVNRYARSERAKIRKAANRWHLADNDAVDYVAILRNDPCSYCGDVAGCVDHIVPRRLGGSSAWMNLTAACRRCNGRKSSRSLLRWLVISNG